MKPSILLAALTALTVAGCTKHPAPDEIDLYQYLKPEKDDVVLYNVRWPSTGKIHGDRIYQVQGNKFTVTYLNNVGKKVSEYTYQVRGDEIAYTAEGLLGKSKGKFKRYIKINEPAGKSGWRLVNAKLQYDGSANAIVENRNCIMLQGEPGPDVIDRTKTAYGYEVLCQGVGSVFGGAFVDGKAGIATELVSLEYAPAK